jgi:hypothetical protein
MSEKDARRAIDAVWRIESARLIAALARIVGDVGLAEFLDALGVEDQRRPAQLARRVIEDTSLQRGQGVLEELLQDP